MRTKVEKLALMQEQLASGMNQIQFCATKSINLGSFRQWKRLFKNSLSEKPMFVELRPSAKVLGESIVIHAGKFKIQVPYQFNKEHLRFVLESIPC